VVRRLVLHLAVAEALANLLRLVAFVLGRVDASVEIELSEPRLADLDRREVGTPTLGGVIEAHVLDPGDGDGIDAAQLTEDFQPGLDEDLLAWGQEVSAAPVVRTAGTTTAFAEPTRPSQRPALFQLLYDLLLVRQVELDVEGVLPIHDDRIALELGPVIDTESDPGRFPAGRDKQLDSEGPEFGPDLLGDAAEELAGLGGRRGGERFPVRIEHEDGVYEKCRHAASSRSVLPSRLHSGLRRLPVVGLGAARSVRD